jgi:hypothetical protein
LPRVSVQKTGMLISLLAAVSEAGVLAGDVARLFSRSRSGLGVLRAWGVRPTVGAASRLGARAVLSISHR